MTSNLQTLRRHQGLSVPELARAAGVSPSSVRRYETDERNPSRTNALMLADALRVPVAALTRYDDLLEVA